MSTLAEARTQLAELLDAVDGYRVRARPSSGTPKPGDGWVTIGRLAPSRFGGVTSVVLVAVLVFGADEVAAEDRIEQDGAALLNATADMLSTDAALEPLTLITGTNATPLYAATLTLTTEVDS